MPSSTTNRRAPAGDTFGVGVAQLPSPRDPIGAAFALVVGNARRPLRVVRTAPSPADSTFARDGGLLVAWLGAEPNETDGAAALAPRALVAGDRAAIGRYAVIGGSLPAGRVIARWGDGRPAAVEASLGTGCIRSVAVGVPAAGDEALRPAFLAVVRELASPCGGGSGALVDDARLAEWERGSARAPGVPRAASSSTSDESGRDARRWLLVVVALLLATEWWIRRSRVAVIARQDASAAGAREAA